ncbi:sphingosine-1-phosphate lyase I [Legionella busanensis]|uniref:Sphingosine-1-phosphate lyase I n=1 Tax=Legionella busanensis TaxID=190655 RepID=A0A378JW91_9GAMM|nr:aminotransferase class V-fold PLP-dependent enzyme [Legionella busanensis]STX52482.1 sphingosine-1-phosphate lyase I [Legionella busanensis]
MIKFIEKLLTTTAESFDGALEGIPPHQIALGIAALYFIYNQYHNPWLMRAFRTRNNKTSTQKIIDAVYDVLKHLPPVQALKDEELNKNLESTRRKLTEQRADMNLQDHIPSDSVPVEAILSEFNIAIDKCAFKFKTLNREDREKQFIVERADGKDSGALYAVHSQELTELLKEVYAKTALTNPMHDKWPRINAMQAEVISWCQNLFHGSDEGYGLITHGGTTSIIEAMAAYVIKARANGITHPEIVVPETAHAAFKKAANLTGATLVIVPVDKKTGAVNAKTMSSYISTNTAVIVGSAPSFMNGINDPIKDLGKLAERKKIPFHVDACLGGFLTAFLDTSAEPMDFRVPGVTSISADLHKYGYCPKGTSICLFSKSSPALSVYAALNWPGGLYATPGILDGSVSGARVAEIYTVLSYYSKKRFKEIAERIIELRQSIQDQLIDAYRKNELNKDDISIYGNPKWSVLGFRSKNLNPHLIADELEKAGWKLNLLQNPAGFHFCLTHVHTLIENFETQFISDLKKAIAAVKNYPADKKPDGNVKVYGAVGMMPTEVQEEVCIQYQKARLQIKPSQSGLFRVKTSSITNMPSGPQNEDGMGSRQTAEF